MLAVLAGCGEATSAVDDSTTPPTEPASTSPVVEEPTEPQCADVWVKKGKLPRQYDGCYEGAEKVKADRTMCSFGRPIITYVDRFYAVPSGTIHRVRGSLQDNRGYLSAMKSCMA